MKRFAVILIIAVLALGCVFADETKVYSGENGKVVDYNSTTGKENNFILVDTTIDTVYPAYQIVAYTSGDASGATVASGTSTHTITGDTSVEGKVSVKIGVQHYGWTGNDTAATTKKDIRYIGTVNVSVSAGELKNKDTNIAVAAANTVSTNGHVYMSAVPTATAFTTVTGVKVGNVDLLTVTKGTASSNSTGGVTAKYENGQALTGTATATTIADGATFTWDTTKLTAGDSYEATITITYTNPS